MLGCTRRPVGGYQIKVSQLTRAFEGAKRGNALFKCTVKQAKKDPVALFRYHDSEGNHVLHHCVHRDSLTDVRTLIRVISVPPCERVDLYNMINAHGDTALHIAVYHGNLRMIRFLLECGINPWIRNKQGYTCLHEACRCRQVSEQTTVEIVDGLLSWNPQLASVTADNSQTPLTLAIYRSSIVLVRTILNHVVSAMKHTPLLSDEAATPRQASMSPTSSETASLSDFFHHLTRGKLSVFHITAIRSRHDMLKLLLEISQETNFTYSSSGYLPIHYACRNGDLDTITILHKATPDLLGNVEQSRSLGKTTYPLHLVVASGSFSATEFVVLNGGSFFCNIQDHRQRIPLHYAAIQGNRSLAELLLQFGSDPLIRDDEGLTSIDLAARKGDSPCLAIIREYAEKHQNLSSI